MANKLFIPDSNPIKFVEKNPTELPQYLSRHLEDYLFGVQQRPWEQKTSYFQKWQTSDTIPLQFESNISPIQIDLMDKYDISRLSFNAIIKRENKWEPGLYVFEVAMSMAAVTPGCYYFKLTAGEGTIIMVSEPQQILVTHENTLLLEYWNSRYHLDVIYETGIRFALRVEGTIGRVLPARASTIYEDEKSNPTVLKSTHLRRFPLKIGRAKGVPEWVVDKFNLIWTHDNVFIDGKQFAAAGDAKIEFTEQDKYPMRGMTMEVREGKNRGSKIVGGVFDPNRRLIVVHNIQSKLFGDISGQASSNVITITDIE